MLADRKSLLHYLRRTQFESYSVLIARLGLKDNFAKQVRFLASMLEWGFGHTSNQTGISSNSMHLYNIHPVRYAQSAAECSRMQDRFSVRSKAQRR